MSTHTIASDLSFEVAQKLKRDHEAPPQLSRENAIRHPEGSRPTVQPRPAYFDTAALTADGISR